MGARTIRSVFTAITSAAGTNTVRTVIACPLIARGHDDDYSEAQPASTGGGMSVPTSFETRSELGGLSAITADAGATIWLRLSNDLGLHPRRRKAPLVSRHGVRLAGQSRSLPRSSSVPCSAVRF
jgi:hypothetical protein